MAVYDVFGSYNTYIRIFIPERTFTIIRSRRVFMSLRRRTRLPDGTISQLTIRLFLTGTALTLAPNTVLSLLAIYGRFHLLQIYRSRSARRCSGLLNSANAKNSSISSSMPLKIPIINPYFWFKRTNTSFYFFWYKCQAG